MAVKVGIRAIGVADVSISRFLGKEVQSYPSKSTYRVQADEALDKVYPCPYIPDVQVSPRRMCCYPTKLTNVQLHMLAGGVLTPSVG